MCFKIYSESLIENTSQELAGIKYLLQEEIEVF
jgi:hypothetical protein